MPFDQSSITSATVSRDDATILVEWTSSAPAGTPFQVYRGSSLVWSGTARRASLPWSGSSRFEIGTVLPSEILTDFAGDLPAANESRALLAWYGGTFLSDTIEEFRIYGEPTPGAGIDYDTPLGTVTAYPQGVILDGAGIGPAGRGGAGHSASQYEWTSGELSGGTWSFAVIAVDAAGNESMVASDSVAIVAPPLPSTPRASDGARLWVAAYNSTTRVATLAWNASPSA